MPVLNAWARTMVEGGGTYADALHMVHIHVIEPHPQAPDVSPYRGDVWEVPDWVLPQPMTHAARAANAASMLPLLEGAQRMLVDELDVVGGVVNPVWCTYGPGPNPAFLIRQDGRIELAQAWFEEAEMKAAIDALLSGATTGP